MQSDESVVLVTIDSLRADHCGFLGADADLTPTLDRFAADGVAFERAIAPGPRTPSSVPTTLTGHFDRTEDLSPTDWFRRYERISEHLHRHRTVAERMRRRGYETIGVSANPWTQHADFDLGFDRFVGIDGDDAIERSAPLTALDAVLRRAPSVGTFDWGQAKHWLVDWTDYYETIVDAVADASEPYFLWVFLLDVHQPYLPPRAHREEISAPGMYYANVRERMLDEDEFPERLTRRLRAAYRDAVRSADAFLGTLERDLGDDDPAFVVHSDHGEAFGEHGTYGHERQLYDENLHVPLVVANAAVSDRVDRPVSLARVPDLVTDLADGTFDGGDRYGRDVVAASTEGEARRAIRGRRWKYVDGAGPTELYDLQSDPDERRDLADSHDEVRTLLDRHARDRRARQVEATELAAAIERVAGQEGSP